MYDAEKFESVELLASALMSGALRALSGPIEKIGATASRRIQRFFGLAPASMQKALKALDRRGLIREGQSTGAVRWRLDDPFLATWLRLAQSTPSSAYPARGPGRAR